MSESSENLIIIVAAVTVLIAALSLGFSFLTVNNYQSQQLTGFVVTNTTLGFVNITILPSVVINFTINKIDFGSGALNAGSTQALLESNTTIVNGSWPGTQNPYLIISNIGSENVSLELNTSQNSSQFIGGTQGVGPKYMFAAIQGAGNSNCPVPASGFLYGKWYDLNATIGTTICGQYNFSAASNQNFINISIRLVVPADSKNGSLGDTLTATAQGP